MLSTRHGTKQKVKETTDETCVETIITVTDKMFAQPSDTKEMVNQARILAQATAQLIQSIKVRLDSRPAACRGRWAG